VKTRQPFDYPLKLNSPGLKCRNKRQVIAAQSASFPVTIAQIIFFPAFYPGKNLGKLVGCKV
jgi:hypothetical protein